MLQAAHWENRYPGIFMVGGCPASTSRHRCHELLASDPSLFHGAGMAGGARVIRAALSLAL